jgi:hypothetical protein
MEKTLFMPLYFKDHLETALLSMNIENKKIEVIGQAVKFTADMTDSEIYQLGFAVGQGMILKTYLEDLNKK